MQNKQLEQRIKTIYNSGTVGSGVSYYVSQTTHTFKRSNAILCTDGVYRTFYIMRRTYYGPSPEYDTLEFLDKEDVIDIYKENLLPFWYDINNNIEDWLINKEDDSEYLEILDETVSKMITDIDELNDIIDKLQDDWKYLNIREIIKPLDQKIDSMKTGYHMVKNALNTTKNNGINNSKT